MKNANGSGSVYKLSGKRRNPWVAVVTIGYTLEGIQKRKRIGSFETKREAQECLLEYNKNPQLYSNVTFRQVKEMWWKTYKERIKVKVTLSTQEYRLKALEPIMDLKMKDIKLFQLQELFDNLHVSWSYKNGCKSALNMIFDFALKNDYVTENKVRFIEIGKHEKVLNRVVFTAEEIETLWKNIDKDHVFIVLILIYSGMRIGEFTNLKNEDIDLDKRIMIVRQSKTSSGVRTIPISSKIYDIIKERVTSKQKYFVKGDTTEQLSYSTFKGRFDVLMKKLGLQDHSIHDTRHTFATLLNNADANKSAIKKLIGHSSFKITEEIYTHKDTEQLRKAIELID